MAVDWPTGQWPSGGDGGGEGVAADKDATARRRRIAMADMHTSAGSSQCRSEGHRRTRRSMLWQ